MRREDRGAPILPQRVTFDPTSDAEWEELRRLGHRMVDDLLAAQRELPSQPVWREVPHALRATFRGSGPRQGIGAEAAYEQVRQSVLPYGLGNWHPRFFGWVQGNGTPLAMLADMIAAGLNPHLGGFNQAPALIERQVISWFAEWFGLPAASGLFVTGGTMANVHALACARIAAARARGHDARRDGVQTWPGEAQAAPMVFYGSSETHAWALKAAEWLGLGARAFRAVPVDEHFRLRVECLADMLAQDRHAGLHPFCVIGTAGTVNTGATDDLKAIATLCREQELWFHVDGAFGALAALSPLVRHQVSGMELADSVAFDLHKWGSMPFECACVLVRDADVHHEAFRLPASYLTAGERGPTAGGMYFNERGLDLTRGFKALKIWMQLQAHGVDHLGEIISQNVRQVRRLTSAIDAHPELERLAPAPLNIVCFRYCGSQGDAPAATGVDVGASAQRLRSEPELDRINREVLARIQERGVALPSSTMIHGRFALRVAHVNHRTTDADIDVVVDHVVAVGREVLAELTE